MYACQDDDSLILHLIVESRAARLPVARPSEPHARLGVQGRLLPEGGSCRRVCLNLLIIPEGQQTPPRPADHLLNDAGIAPVERRAPPTVGQQPGWPQ